MHCGYALQNSQNPLTEREHISRIYLWPVKNETLKAGIESVVYNAVQKSLLAHQRVQVVSQLEDADAVLYGKVIQAEQNQLASAAANTLPPLSLPPENSHGVQIATLYNAALSCEFSLKRTHFRLGASPEIWSQGFNRSKSFPGGNQRDVPGTTSPLITESELDRSLREMARLMMDDVHESMLALF